MFDLALLFVYVFLLSFDHFNHLASGRGSWSLCLLCICLLVMHTLICVTFSLPPGVMVGCDFCLWLFLDFSDYPFPRNSCLSCYVLLMHWASHQSSLRLLLYHQVRVGVINMSLSSNFA